MLQHPRVSNLQNTSHKPTLLPAGFSLGHNVDGDIEVVETKSTVELDPPSRTSTGPSHQPAAHTPRAPLPQFSNRNVEQRQTMRGLRSQNSDQLSLAAGSSFPHPAQGQQLQQQTGSGRNSTDANFQMLHPICGNKSASSRQSGTAELSFPSLSTLPSVPGPQSLAASPSGSNPYPTNNLLSNHSRTSHLLRYSRHASTGNLSPSLPNSNSSSNLSTLQPQLSGHVSANRRGSVLGPYDVVSRHQSTLSALPKPTGSLVQAPACQLVPLQQQLQGPTLPQPSLPSFVRTSASMSNTGISMNPAASMPAGCGSLLQSKAGDRVRVALNAQGGNVILPPRRNSFLSPRRSLSTSLLCPLNKPTGSIVPNPRLQALDPGALHLLGSKSGVISPSERSVLQPHPSLPLAPTRLASSSSCLLSVASLGTPAKMCQAPQQQRQQQQQQQQQQGLGSPELPSEDLGGVLQWQQGQLLESLRGPDSNEHSLSQQQFPQQVLNTSDSLKKGHVDEGQSLEDRSSLYPQRNVTFGSMRRKDSQSDVPGSSMGGVGIELPRSYEGGEGGRTGLKEEEEEEEEREEDKGEEEGDEGQLQIEEEVLHAISWCWHEVVAKRCIDPVSGG